VRITLFAIGRLKAGPEKDLSGRYLDRFAKAGAAIGLDLAQVREVAESRASTAIARKQEEATVLRSAIPAGGALLLLDERGQNLDSSQFTALLQHLRDSGQRDLVVAIGGPDGFDPDLHRDATAIVCLGKLTWPHQVVRILIAEQLYRCVTILSGHPYHRA
jgi:23S rRNA (pseudouridine1915-N3)-methyltransferase